MVIATPKNIDNGDYFPLFALQVMLLSTTSESMYSALNQEFDREGTTHWKIIAGIGISADGF